MHNLSDLTSGFLNAFPNIYFTSDTHFGHVRILELSGRPFADVDAHNQALIDNWNTVVRSQDLVIHLGDVALGKIADSLPMVGLLNGYKILIPGNHDRVFSGEKEKMRVRFDPEYRKVFDEVWPEIVTGYIPHLESVVTLSHFPYSGDSQENDRHVDKRPTNSSLPLIHGHIHETRHIEGNMFNAGVDVNDYTPVHHSVIRDWIKTL
jgi:calcineurin-like phosphoesterase family protein